MFVLLFTGGQAEASADAEQGRGNSGSPAAQQVSNREAGRV